MIGTIDISESVNNSCVPTRPIHSYKDSPSTIKFNGVPKRVGEWCVTRVYLNVTTPDLQNEEYECVQVGDVWIVTTDSCSTCGRTQNGYILYADGKDENGDDVTGYKMCVGDVLVTDPTLNVVPETIQASTIENYKSTTTQTLKHVNGRLKWIDG